MAKKKVDPKAKAKRQKIILGCVGAVFVLLLVVQVPKTMKMLNAKAPADESHASPATAAAPSAPTVPGAAVPPVVDPTQATAQPAAVVTEGVGIPDTSIAPAAGSGQLIVFDRFKTKDPFVQQVVEGATTAPTAPAATAPAAPPASAEPPAASATPTVPGTSATPPAASIPSAVTAAPTTATISVNGGSEPVALKASFPKASPTFTLLGLTKTVAKIGIVGGSYSDGGSAITLKLGKTVTLMNTADGTRYKLRLISVS